jgi:hypothetical protein
MTSLSLGFEGEHKCGCKGKTMKKGCCSDKIAVFKLDTEQQRPTSLNLVLVKAPDLNFFHDFPVSVCILSQIARKQSGCYLHPPNGFHEPPSYLMHQVFRI